MEFDETEETVWLTRLMNGFVERSPLGESSTILLTVGIVPYVLTAAFLALIGGDVPSTFLVAQLLASTLLAIAPVLVWNYEMAVFPTFVERAAEVTPHDDNRELLAIATRYKRFFASEIRPISVLWTGLVLLAVFANYEYFESLGVTGYADPAFLVYTLFAVWLGSVTAIGVQGAITTNLCLREIGELDFTIDPLHPDGLGGLSTVGYFAIRTTTMISVGALGLPLAFDIARIGGFSEIIYGLVVVYVGMIVGSFVFPTVYINRRANEIKRDHLMEKREEIHELHTRLLDSDDPEAMSTMQIKLDELRNEYEIYDRVSLYPMSLSIASRLASSVLLPLAFLLFETYLA